MMSDADGVIGALASRRTALFLVAAVLLAVFAANTTLRTFAGTSYRLIQGLVGPAGFFVGVVGLFGLYPALAEENPRLARAAAVVAVLPFVGWFLVVLGTIGEAAGVFGGMTGPFLAIPIGTIATTTLAFGLFGVAVLRAGVPSRAVGVFLLVPAVMFVLLMTRTAPPFVIDIGHLVGHLGVALTLWTRDVPADRGEPAADATP